jgi:hypothetical protein
MSKPQKVIADKVIGTKLYTNNKTINERDAMIYAIGIGFNEGI